MPAKKYYSVPHQLDLWRRHFGLSHAELARRAGLTPSFLSQIEKGHSQASLETLGKLAAAMQITRGTLLDIDPKNPSTPLELLLPLGFLDRLPQGLSDEVDLMLRIAKETLLLFVMKYADERAKQQRGTK